MFVLLRAYELTHPSLGIPERIALTMERGGISIMFTSITDLVAFCVGAVSPLSKHNYISELIFHIIQSMTMWQIN